MSANTTSFRQLLESYFDEANQQITITASLGQPFAALLELLSVLELRVTQATLEPAHGTAPPPVHSTMTGKVSLWGVDDVDITIEFDEQEQGITAAARFPRLRLATLGQFVLPISSERLVGLDEINFQQVQVNASTQKQETIITGAIPEGWSLLGLDGISIDRPELMAKIQTDSELLNTYTVELTGTLKLSTVEIPIAIDIPLGIGGWRLLIRPPGVRLPSLTALVELMAGVEVLPFLPDKVSTMTEFTLSSLLIQFDPSVPRWQGIDFAIVSSNPWEIAPKLAVEEVALSLSIRPDTPSASFYGYVFGSLRIGSINLTATIVLPLFGGPMTLQADSNQPLPGLGELASFIDADFAAALPDGMGNIGSLILHYIQLQVDLSKPEITSFGFQVFSYGDWVIIPDYLALEDLQFQLEATHASQTWGITGSAAGTIEIKETRVSVMMQRPSPDGGWFLQVTEPLALPGLGDIATLVGGDYAGNTLPTDMRDIGSLTIYELEMAFEGTPQKLANISFDLQASGDWAFVPDKVVLTDLEISFHIVQPTDAALREITGSITATLDLGEVVVYMSATDPPEASAGWQFEGHTGDDQEIAIGLLIEDLVSKFGGITLPSALEELVIENLAVSFNTQSKDFTFSGEAKFPVEGQEVDLTITIDIKHQQDNTYDKHFSGQLTIDGLLFDVIFDETPDTKLFVAGYHDETGKPIKVDDLIKEVFATGVTTGLAFTLKDGMFAYRSYKEGQATRSQYLFGMDIEGGLKLSDVKLPDLPLIGQPLPPEQTLALAFQVLVPSQPFTADQVTIFNGLISGGNLSLPQKPLQPPVNMSIVLRMDRESKLVELPVGVSTQSDGQGNGLVSQNQAQVTSSSPSGAQVTANDGTQWLKIQKSFGPVYFERVGLNYESGEVTGLLDAALSAGGLNLALEGLAVKSPLDHLAPEFSLHGLGLDYRNGPLEIGGSLLQVVTEQGTEYDGLAVIRTEQLTLVAIGSYTRLDDHPSLFLYAVLDYPLGGPSFFFVTGLAAGFGYNRMLDIPPIEQVATFPLVAQVIGGNTPPSLPTDQAGRQQTLTTQLHQLSQYIPPTVGETFLAVGIKFTSFKLIDSFAMLVVQFGQHFELDILGLSVLKVPTPEAGKAVTPLAEANLALRARFAPDEGILTVRAQLTPASYIFSGNCHLTGGFAFYAWFAPHPNQGDFVITLGGYHPRYIIPSHYPRIPRLGFNWQIDRYLSLKGGVYYALTPHALMAGGHLEATWEKGSLKAWFKAGADFLITWKPYHYDISIYIDLGASYTFHLLGTHHVKVELGADLRIWGPEFSGIAHIHWYIISFTVRFGSHAAQRLKPIDWPTFKSSFLPEQMCGVSIQAGLTRQITDDQQQERWIIDPKGLVLVTNSVIPINQAPGHAATLAEAETAFGVTPVAVKASDLTTTHSITITSAEVENSETLFKVAPILKAVPASLWAEPELDGHYLKPPQLNEKRLIENTLAGFAITPAQPPKPGTTDDIDRRDLRYDTEQVPDAYAWQDFAVAPEDLADDIQKHKGWARAKQTIPLEEAEKRVSWALVDKTVVTNQATNQAVNTRRADVLQAVGVAAPTLDFGQSMAQGALFPPQIESMTDAQKKAVAFNQLIETALTMS